MILGYKLTCCLLSHPQRSDLRVCTVPSGNNSSSQDDMNEAASLLLPLNLPEFLTRGEWTVDTHMTSSSTSRSPGRVHHHSGECPLIARMEGYYVFEEMLFIVFVPEDHTSKSASIEHSQVGNKLG